MQRIIFGDNQFFAVNHMSEEKARAQAIKFQDIGEIIRVIDDAYASGIRAFMCTTHEKIFDVCEHVRANGERYKDFEFYPCMPYAHKYANAVTEHGMIGALQKFLPSSNSVAALVKGGLSVATKDVEGIAKLLIDAEMKMFHGLPTPIVFMQNILTDLILGLGAFEAFSIFASHVRDRYGAEPGFITMNLPRLSDALKTVGIDRPVVCCNFNKVGFRMSGGLEAYERVLRDGSCRVIAMSVFASGAIRPQEALLYVCGTPGIEAIVFGASSRANIKQTSDLIRSLDSNSAAVAA